MLVLPGYLGTKRTVHQWAQFSHKHCLLIITDYKDVHDTERLMTSLEDDNLCGTEPYLDHILMTANYLSQRKESEFSKENSDLCIPASSALAGRLANTEDWSIVQAAVGVRNGEIVGGYRTRIKLQNAEIDSIIAQGLIPINEQDGIVTALSLRTLYLGPIFARQNYAFIRVLDWIVKSFQTYCNDHCMEVWTPQIKSLITSDIHNFLCDYKGPGGIFEKFTNLKIEQNPKTKDITVSVEIIFPGISQNFYLEMIGRGDEWGIPEWTQKILCS